MHRIWSYYTLPDISGFLEPWCKLPRPLCSHSKCQQTSPMQMMTSSTTDWTVAWASWTTAVAPPEWSNFIYLILFIGQGYDYYFFYFYCRNPANGITIIAFQDNLGATNTFQTADIQWYEFMYKSMKQPARTNHMWNPVASITIERNRGICTLFYFLLGNISVGPPQLCRSPEGLGRPQFSHTPLSLKPLSQTFQKPKLFFVVLCSFCALPQGKFH